MTDQTSDRNEKLKAAMRDQTSTNLNTSGKEGVVVRSPNQCGATKRPTNHIDPSTGKRS
jgi:hypothetical protein